MFSHFMQSAKGIDTYFLNSFMFILVLASRIYLVFV